MKTVEVAVLGCGPAGLLAAEGALDYAPSNDIRVRVRVYSIKRKSEIHGAQYLHENVLAGLSMEPEELICYYKMGTKEGYAEKIYDSPTAPVSWDHFDQGLHPGWPLIGMYDYLWARWRDAIVPANFTTDSTGNLLEWSRHQNVDVVVSTIPAMLTCHDDRHRFPRKPIWVTDRAWVECPDNTVIYNGNPLDDWYRSSKLFGHESTEFMHPVEGAVRGMKVINTNCDCLEKLTQWSLKEPRKVVLAPAGRWGRWQRGILVHHAFHEAQRAVRRYMQVAMGEEVAA
jgi:hypothetical protein